MEEIPSNHGGRKRASDHDGGVSDMYPEPRSGLRVRDERVERARGSPTRAAQVSSVQRTSPTHIHLRLFFLVVARGNPKTLAAGHITSYSSPTQTSTCNVICARQYTQHFFGITNLRRACFISEKYDE